MDLGEIIKDSIMYPINNIKSLVIYLVLGLIIGLVAVLTGVGGLLSLNFGSVAITVVSIIGLIIMLCVYLLMFGFSLDIVKFGINRDADGPGIDLVRQIVNGLKYIVLSIVYLIIPYVIMYVLALVDLTIASIIGYILLVVFSFLLIIAICRLADSDSLGYALNISGVIEDIKQIGWAKLVITVVVALVVGLIIVFVLTFILSMIIGIISQELLLAVVPIMASVLDAWLLFYLNRSMGLLYSSR